MKFKCVKLNDQVVWVPVIEERPDVVLVVLPDGDKRWMDK